MPDLFPVITDAEWRQSMAMGRSMRGNAVNSLNRQLLSHVRATLLSALSRRINQLRPNDK
jgi:hypothetical protein